MLEWIRLRDPKTGQFTTAEPPKGGGVKTAVIETVKRKLGRK